MPELTPNENQRFEDIMQREFGEQNIDLPFKQPPEETFVDLTHEYDVDSEMLSPAETLQSFMAENLEAHALEMKGAGMLAQKVRELSFDSQGADSLDALRVDTSGLNETGVKAFGHIAKLLYGINRLTQEHPNADFYKNGGFRLPIYESNEVEHDFSNHHADLIVFMHALGFGVGQFHGDAKHSHSQGNRVSGRSVSRIGLYIPLKIHMPGKNGQAPQNSENEVIPVLTDRVVTRRDGSGKREIAVFLERASSVEIGD